MHDISNNIKKIAKRDSPIEILFVITTSPNKRWHILLEQAVELTLKEPGKYVFHLVTPQQSFFRKEVAKKYSKIDIVFHSDLSQEQMNNLYLRVDFYWSASIVEGFGMPVRLATLANVNVITPDTDINRESSCGLGYYYDQEKGDCHAEVTISIRKNKLSRSNKELRQEINRIKLINKTFIKDFLAFYSRDNYQKQK